METVHRQPGETAVVPGAVPHSARGSLSRDRIVEAAIAYIGEHGLAQLSMRKLGTELGVEAMSLYRYLPGREVLLDAVVERLVNELNDDPDVVSEPDAGWQDFLQRLAHGVRRIALRHPKVFPLVASRPPEAPWLRPPLRSLAWVELFLTRLQDDGFSDDAVVAAYRGFTSFLLGHLLLEVAGHGADIGALDTLTPAQPQPGLAEYPQVHRLSASLAEDHAALEFEESLENLLDRLQLLL
ncbi:MAG TPA: TetR/AcrR family transcriptional regulator C-terminal domain-containing protein [Dermatophilaceae bacterium]|nr:TetR/AcrR family transcriptional regulator C-terminal domain-containing protein [Dermatophilaceae bacterium]